MVHELLDADQLAQLFRLTKAWVYKLTSTGQISYYKIGKRVYFKRQDIETFIERSRVECRSTKRKGAPAGISDAETEVPVSRCTATAETPNLKLNRKKLQFANPDPQSQTK